MAFAFSIPSPHPLPLIVQEQVILFLSFHIFNRMECIMQRIVQFNTHPNQRSHFALQTKLLVYHTVPNCFVNQFLNSSQDYSGLTMGPGWCSIQVRLTQDLIDRFQFSCLTHLSRKASISGKAPVQTSLPLVPKELSKKQLGFLSFKESPVAFWKAGLG